MSDAHDLLTSVGGIGDNRANTLLNTFGSGHKVAKRTSSNWGAIKKLDGFSEEQAKTLFEKMLDAEVYDELKRCY